MLDASFLKPGASLNQSSRNALLGAIDRAFLIMALLLGALFVIFVLCRRLVAESAPNHRREASARIFDGLQSRWAIFGAVAIGLYVGAEVSIGSIMIAFLNQPQVLALPVEDAGGYLANFYWGGALIGRLVGTVLLTRVRASHLLFACGGTAVLLCVTVLAGSGPIIGYAALAIGLTNSIMFPTIFTITLERSGVSQSSTSGLLCLAIVGGAVLPLAVGAMADRYGLGFSFLVPLIAYAVIAAFAFAARDLPARNKTDFNAASRVAPIP